MNLKTLLGVAVLAVAMTGCLGSDDPNFTVESEGRILQKEEGGATKFALYIRAWPKSGEIGSMTVKIDGMSSAYDCEPLYGTTIWATTLSYSTMIPYGKYSVILTGTDGEVSTWNYPFDVTADKKLGNLNVNEFTYDGTKITAKWDRVENATAYMVSFIPEGFSDGISLGFNRGWGTMERFSDVLTQEMGSLRIPSNYNNKGALIQVAVVAIGSGQLSLEGEYRTLKVGTPGWYTGN